MACSKNIFVCFFQKIKSLTALSVISDIFNGESYNDRKALLWFQELVHLSLHLLLLFQICDFFLNTSGEHKERVYRMAIKLQKCLTSLTANVIGSLVSCEIANEIRKLQWRIWRFSFYMLNPKSLYAVCFCCKVSHCNNLRVRKHQQEFHYWVMNASFIVVTGNHEPRDDISEINRGHRPLTSLAMLLRASSSAEKRSLIGARFRPDPGVPMSAATPQLNQDQLASLQLD